MPGPCALLQVSVWHFLHLATTTVRRSAPQENCFLGKRLFARRVSGPWASGVPPAPQSTGRGEGLRPCLGNVVSYTWVCGILFTWLHPLGIGFPQQEHIAPRKPFLPQGVSGLGSFGLKSCCKTAGMREVVRRCLGTVVSYPTRTLTGTQTLFPDPDPEPDPDHYPDPNPNPNPNLILTLTLTLTRTLTRTVT